MNLSMTLFSVAIVWCVAVITPCPNFFVTIQTAIGQSRRSALFVVLGISTGTTIWVLSGYLGINFLFRTIPWIYIFLKLLGGAYLIHLGIKLIRTNQKDLSENRTFRTTNPVSTKSFKLGLLTNLSNPKTAAFVASLFAATMPPDASYVTGFASVALMMMISAVWYSLVAFIFSLSQLRTVYQRARVWIERISGIIFMGFGIKLATSQ